jgi:hypothetical protein
MDEITKQAVWIFAMLIFFFASVVGISGIVSQQYHQEQMETYNLVSKCRQQSSQNADVVCGPLPKFEWWTLEQLAQDPLIFP